MDATFLEQVDGLKLPGNALDMLIDDLGGFDAVADTSGRSERLVRNYKGEFYTQKRTENGLSMHEQNLHEVVARSSSGGRSVRDHLGRRVVGNILARGASPARVKNRRRRVHITLELRVVGRQDWLQQIGRSHRANQASARVPASSSFAARPPACSRQAAAIARRPCPRRPPRDGADSQVVGLLRP